MKENNAFPFSQFKTTKTLTENFPVVQCLTVRAVFDPHVRSLVGKEWNG